MRTIALFIPFMILSVTDISSVIPYKVKGIVVDEGNKPIVRAYISVVQGEEEALTDKDGNFVLTTWQALPVTVTIQHADFTAQKIVIRDTAQKEIKLRYK
ncbi:MAG: carboxypeptidase-like regulatory domain-containing protein [Filimonas sp.]|nr:carboxypeptidase-like regulatory domain-containing protein [Filimonas sp.]